MPERRGALLDPLGVYIPSFSVSPELVVNACLGINQESPPLKHSKLLVDKAEPQTLPEGTRWVFCLCFYPASILPYPSL